MRGTHNSKRISWAPEVKLCQVRLFLSEEAPSQVGLNAQDHLQVKSLWMPHSNGTASDDAFPPGFEGAHSVNQQHIQLSEIPLVKWICPPRFELNFCWQVVAGEESKEVDIQNRREMRVLEAFYPCKSDIPPNASVLVDVNNLPHNEQQIPLIPITPIEDEDAHSEFLTTASVSMSSQSALVNGIPPPHSCSIPSLPNGLTSEKEPAGMVGDVTPDVVAAASAALTAIGRTNEPGSLFDSELLIKILSTPKLIEKLVTESGTSSTKHPIPKTSSHFAPLSIPPSAVTSSDPSTVQMPRPESSGVPLVVATSRGSYYPSPPPHPNGVGLVPFPDARMGTGRVSTPPVGVPQARDVNYYKNLIQQHGGERQEVPHQYLNSIEQHGGERQHPQKYNYLMNQQHGEGRREAPQQFVGRYKYQHEMMNNPKARDSKHKINKACAYFNSSRGCRHGTKCAFQHDANTQQQQRSNNMSDSQGQSAKRMKFDRV